MIVYRILSSRRRVLVQVLDVEQATVKCLLSVRDGAWNWTNQRAGAKARRVRDGRSFGSRGVSVLSFLLGSRVGSTSPLVNRVLLTAFLL